MGFFKKDKHPSAGQQQQAIQQQQQLVTAQNQATHLQSTISQLQAQLSEQNRLVHLYRTESANVQTELQNTRRQLQSTQGNLSAEVFQRQAIDRRLQETDFEYTMRLSSLDDELARSRQVTDQLRQELSSSSGIAEQYRRENVNLKQALEDLRRQYEVYRQDASRRLQDATPASPRGNGGTSPERAGSNRSSTGSPWGAIFANTQPAAELPAHNTGHSGTVSPGHRVHVRQSQPQLRPSPGQTNPFRPVSTTGTRSSAHLPSAGIIITTPTPSSTLQSPPPYRRNPPYQRNPPGSPAQQGPNPQRQTPAFLVPVLRATPAPIEEEESDSDTSMPDQEEAQHRRAILESAEISRYEDRVRAAEASREQMQAQFTALSGEVATLRKTLEEKDRELFVRDNQLEWVQQRAAALVREDGDSPFLVDL